MDHRMSDSGGDDGPPHQASAASHRGRRASGKKDTDADRTIVTISYGFGQRKGV